MASYRLGLLGLGSARLGVVITLLGTTSEMGLSALAGVGGSSKQRAPMGLQPIFRCFRTGNANLEMLLSAPNNARS